MYGVYFQIEALLSLKNAWMVTPKFCFLRIVLNSLLRKNTPVSVLVGITKRKSEYLEMRRTYAQ